MPVPPTDAPNNPFAPLPIDPLPASGSSNIDTFPLENGQMEVPDGATLPTHCMECGEPVHPDALKPISVRWVPVWIYLLFLVASLIALFAYVFASRRATLHLGYCETHMRSRLLGRRAQIASLAAVLLWVFLLFFWAREESSEAQAISYIFLLVISVGTVGYLWGRRKLQYPRILEISNGKVRLEPGPGYVARENALRGPSGPNPSFSMFLKE